MITHAPQHVHTAVADDRPQGPIASVLWRFQQALCALRGHDAILQYERNRIFLRCTSCGHETPGWEVSSAEASIHRVEARSALRPAGDLAVARKIA